MKPLAAFQRQYSPCSDVMTDQLSAESAGVVAVRMKILMASHNSGNGSSDKKSAVHFSELTVTHTSNKLHGAADDNASCCRFKEIE